jgi:hypothetical protein
MGRSGVRLCGVLQRRQLVCRNVRMLLFSLYLVYVVNGVVGYVDKVTG